MENHNLLCVLGKICRDLWWKEMKEEFSVLSVDSEDTEVKGSQIWCPLAVPILMVSFEISRPC